MKKFIVTGSFAGQLNIVYTENDLLGKVEYMGGELLPEQIGWLQRNLPIVYDSTFPAFVAKSKLTFIEERYEVTFEQFWEAYDLKVHKKRAQDAWGRMSKADKVKALMGVAPYDRHLQRSGYGKAHADTYLKDRYFDNDWNKLRK